MNKSTLKIQLLIATIDEILSSQINTIIHHHKFQTLEASWRGLHYLITQNLPKQNKLKIKLLNIDWDCLTTELLHNQELEHNELFNKIYNEEFGKAGGEPYGLLIGDYYISHKNPINLEVLALLANISAAAFAPFVAAASPSLFGVDEFSALQPNLNLEAIFNLQEYKSWNKLQQLPESCFIGLTLPQTLLRNPYLSRRQSFCFQETIDTQGDCLWGNTSYCFAAVICRSFSRSNWLLDIRGVDGGLVTNLVRQNFTTDKPGVTTKFATNLCITDTTEKAFTDLGFIPLTECSYTNLCAFYSCNSIQVQNHNSKTHLGAMLHYLLCASRFAHYIKVIMRDKTGSFSSATELEHYLQQWLLQYTANSGTLDQEQQAKYPLRQASVTITTNPKKPGHYRCTLDLQPHSQFDSFESKLQLVTEHYLE